MSKIEKIIKVIIGFKVDYNKICPICSHDHDGGADWKDDERDESAKKLAEEIIRKIESEEEKPPEPLPPAPANELLREGDSKRIPIEKEVNGREAKNEQA